MERAMAADPGVGLVRLDEWVLLGGGWDGQGECEHLRCHDTFGLSWGMSVQDVLVRITMHECGQAL